MLLKRLGLICCMITMSGCAINSSFSPFESVVTDRPAAFQQMIGRLPELEASHMQAREKKQFELVNFVQTMEQEVTFVSESAPQQWLVLSPDEAVCRALKTAKIDEITQREKEVVNSGVSPLLKHYYRSQLDLAEDLIDSVANSEKEKLALTVLQLYYGLAEVHAQADVMRRSQELLDKLSVQVNSIVEADIEELQTKISPEDIRRRHYRLAKEKSVLHSKARTLTTQLNVILGLKTCDVYPIWTDCNLAQQNAEVDLDAATDLAIRCRKDLRSLIKLSNARSRDIAAIGRVAAAQFHPSFGEFDLPPNSTLAMLTNSLNLKQKQTESDARREQVRNLRDKMEKAIRTEIAREANEVQELIEKIELQRMTVESWRKQGEQMKAKRQVGKATFDELLEPKVEGLKAESELVHLASSLEIAIAKLRVSQGILIQKLFSSREHHCGFRLGETPQPMNIAEQIPVAPDFELHQVLQPSK